MDLQPRGKNIYAECLSFLMNSAEKLRTSGNVDEDSALENEELRNDGETQVHEEQTSLRSSPGTSLCSSSQTLGFDTPTDPEGNTASPDSEGGINSPSPARKFKNPVSPRKSLKNSLKKLSRKPIPSITEKTERESFLRRKRAKFKHS